MELVEEHGYNDKQSSWLISSARGSGKTTMILDRLVNHYRGAHSFEEIYWCSPSAYHDDKVTRGLKKLASKRCAVFIVSDSTKWLPLIEELSNLPPASPKRCVVLDDMAWYSRLLKSPVVSRLFFNGRHTRVTIFISVQYLKAVGPTIRSNITELSVFTLPNAREIETIAESYPIRLPSGQLLSTKEWMDVYRNITRTRYKSLNLKC